MKLLFMILILLIACKTNRREVNIYSKPTIIKSEEKIVKMNYSNDAECLNKQRGLLRYIFI
jgi:hypothetical protein